VRSKKELGRTSKKGSPAEPSSAKGERKRKKKSEKKLIKNVFVERELEKLRALETSLKKGEERKQGRQKFKQHVKTLMRGGRVSRKRRSGLDGKRVYTKDRKKRKSGGGGGKPLVPQERFWGQKRIPGKTGAVGG